jgi:uncharacterized RDD family membrane protein YckC
MNWHYAQNGQQVGPVTDEQLSQLFQAGKINQDTLVWREGMPDWRPYQEAVAQSNQPFASMAQAPGAEISPSDDQVVCSECGGLFPVGEIIRVGKASVCATCKPLFLQKLSEGARINTGELDYAGIPARFAAIFLDGLLLGAVNFGINFIIGLMASVSTRPVDGKLPAGFLVLQLILFVINITTAVTYETILIGKYGATLGKMACKIHVVTADGGKVTYARAFGRYFAKLLSSLTCLIGFIMALFDDQKRALHDHICNTRVIKNPP